MTTFKLSRSRGPDSALLRETIDTYGATRVLLAAAIALFRGVIQTRARPPDAGRLNARLRRDIGLVQEPDLPAYWDHYR